MEIDVFDSYSQSKSGQLMHFDILVPKGTAKEDALSYGRDWLNKIGEESEGLAAARCNYCHSEMADPAVTTEINTQGYYILKMQGCPA
jgi:hypothetical protein